MKFLAEISITPTSSILILYELTSFKCVLKDLSITQKIAGSYDFSKFISYFFEFLNKNSSQKYNFFVGGLKTYTGLFHRVGKFLVYQESSCNPAYLHRCPFLWFKKFASKVAQKWLKIPKLPHMMV